MESNINYLNLADEYQQNKMYDLAIENYLKAIEQNPDNPQIYNALAMCYYSKQDYISAINSYEKINDICPEYPSVYNNLGIIYSELKEYDKSIENFKKAIELNPEYAAAYNSLGNAFYNTKEYDKSIQSFNRAIELNPNYADAYCNAGITLHKTAKYDEAIQFFQKSLSLNPNNAETYYNLGISYYEKELLDLSNNCYLKALQLNPRHINSYNNLGRNLNKTRKYDEAIEILKTAISLFPDYSKAYYNLGVSYYEKRLFDLAQNAFIKDIELNSAATKSYYCLGGIYLMKGEFEKGWELYEKRLLLEDSEKVVMPVIYKPRWNGEDLKNKTIYVYREQGFGDTLMFSRYVLMLQDIAQKVVFKPQQALKELFITSDFKADIIDESIPEDNLEFDVHIPLLSLPLLFKTSINSIPYSEGFLEANPEKLNYYKNKYFNNNKFKVGICWQVNPKVMKERAAKLKNFYKLFEIENIEFYSLQKGYGSEKLQNLPASINITNLGDTFDDYSDTAAAIANLDLVIAVDTSIAHLAGAMNKQTWVVIHKESEWRWMIDREDSPWYKSVKLFRQQETDNWEELFNRVYNELKTKI